MEQPYTLPADFDALRFMADLYAEDGELFEAEVTPVCAICHMTITDAARLACSSCAS